MLPLEFDSGIEEYSALTGAVYEKDLLAAIYQRVRNWPASLLRDCLDMISRRDSVPRNLFGALCAARSVVIERGQAKKPEELKRPIDVSGINLWNAFNQLTLFIQKKYGHDFQRWFKYFCDKYWYPFCGTDGPNANSHEFMMQKIREAWAEITASGATQNLNPRLADGGPL